MTFNWYKNKQLVNRIFIHIFLIIITILILFPAYWLFATSVKLPSDVFSHPPMWFPFRITLENIRYCFSFHKFYIPLENTLIISITSTLGALIIGTFAAYGITKLKYANTIATIILVFRMIPQIMIIIPLFILFKNMDLIDTKIALITTFITFQLPFVIWLMRGFLSELPIELEESAKIDGCGPLGSFLRVVLPISKPGLATAAILTLIATWNEYMFTIVLSRSFRTVTMVLSLNQLITYEKLPWSDIAAESVIITIPILLISFFVQRQIVYGMTMGAVKE
jgi:multiple sugar transport system permease protein